MVLKATSKEQQLVRKRIVARLGDFPSMPTVATRVIEIVVDPESSVKDLEPVVKSDVSLVASLLKLANSAFYGLRRQVHTLNHAIVLLGKDEIRNIVLAHVMFNTFKLQKPEQKEIVSGFWRHSLECGLAAEFLAAQEEENSEAMFLAGMIHDIGKLFVVSYFFKEISIVPDYGRSPANTDLIHEKEVLGAGHDELGSQILYRWMFPAKFIKIAREHHEYEKFVDFDKETQIVILADILTRYIRLQEWEEENGEDDCQSSSLAESFISLAEKSTLSLKDRNWEELVADYRTCLEEKADLLGMLVPL